MTDIFIIDAQAVKIAAVVAGYDDQAQVAKELGISRHTVAKIFTGDMTVKLVHFLAFAALCNVTADSLLVLVPAEVVA